MHASTIRSALELICECVMRMTICKRFQQQVIDIHSTVCVEEYALRARAIENVRNDLYSVFGLEDPHSSTIQVEKGDCSAEYS